MTLDLFTQPDALRLQWEEFHGKHPEVMDELIRLARTQKRVRKRGSMKQLFEILRWDRMMAGLPDEGEDFKLNNNYTAIYAREVMKRAPDLDGFFELRKRTTA